VKRLLIDALLTSWADKASRFAALCSRHGGEAGAIVQVRIAFTRAKYVKYNDTSWQAEGFDACRAERTSASQHPEWCLKSPSQVVVQEIRKIECGVDLPAFEGEALSLGGVRHLANRTGLAEVYFDEQNAVVSFAADANAPDSGRVDVYFLTGTVCSIFEHPRQGTMRAVRRKVDLDSLEQLFRKTCSSSSGSCSCHAPSAGSKRPASGDCRCGGIHGGVKMPRQSLSTVGTIACPELAGEWRPAKPSLWTRPHQAQHDGTVERWDNSGVCHYQTELDGGVIVITDKSVNPLYGLFEYRCKGVTGSACQAPQLILRWNPDGTRSWDLGRWGAEHWQRVQNDSAKVKDSACPRGAIAGGEEDEVKATLDKLRNEVKEAEAVLEDHRLRREEEKRRAAEEEKRRAAEEEKQRAAEEEKRRAAEEEKWRAAQAKMESRGTSWTSSLCHDADFCCQLQSKDVRCVATNGDSSIYLYDDGKWAYTAGLPDYLYKKLNGRAWHHPAPTYVALGTMDRYYIRFANGKSEWMGCEGMSDVLDRENRSVRTVAFGEDWDSYFVVFDCGWWSYSNVPKGLSDLLAKRGKRADLTAVSLGPNGEWYLEAQNGRAWWDGCAYMLEQTDDIQNKGGDVKFIDFGSDDAYIIRWS
jgi:hypothetical protein